jgi:penicillin-binding protein 1A
MRRPARAGPHWVAVALGWAGATTAILVLGFIGYCAVTLPASGAGNSDAPSSAVAFTGTDGKVFAVRGVVKGDRVGIDRLPADLVHAVVAVEDRRFYWHLGIDLRGILRAAWHDLRGGGGLEGASTITQQLVRLTYLSPERSLRRKVQEMIVALWLETRLSKDQILARYLNTAYFGAGAYGIEAAAQRYFGKKPEALNLAESAVLAGLIRSPSQLAPTHNPEAARRRADAVLSAMVGAGYLDAGRAAAARDHPAELALPPDSEPGQNYFADTAAGELRRLIGTPPLELSADTTLDLHLQQAAERVVQKFLGQEGARRHVGQAALVALAPDGAVLALVGGRDHAQSQFNRAVQAHRQAGSLFKIFVYLAAFGSGYTPDSIVVDQPVTIGDWEPKNFEDGYRGPITLRTAFAQSINTVSVQLTQAVGVERVIDMARSLGIKTELPPVPSLALGSAEVTLLDMTAAMDAIAVDAKSIEPYTIRRIRAVTRASNQASLYMRPDTVIEKPTWNRNALVQLLERVVASGTGRAARPGRRAAGKTGTTQDYRDAWFVGFTSNIVVGVWVGNDDNSPMDGVVGGDLPARIWRDFVKEAEPILSTPVATARLAGEPQTASGPAAAPAPAILRGVPTVADTSTLVFPDGVAQLQGVAGEGGELAHELERYLRGREVVCEAVAPATRQYRCDMDNIDIAEAVVLNGAGRADANAPKRLQTAQQKAQAAGRGIWRE